MMFKQRTKWDVPTLSHPGRELHPTAFKAGMIAGRLALVGLGILIGWLLF